MMLYKRAVLLALALVLLIPHVSGHVTGSLEVFSKTLEPGEEAKALLKIQNLNFTDFNKVSVLVRYSVLDSGGNAIKSESGTFPVSDSRDVVLKLTMPQDAQPGIYIFEAELTSQGNVSVYRDGFEIPGQGSPLSLYLVLPVVVVIAAILLAKRRL
jgi:hypothetical protein